MVVTCIVLAVLCLGQITALRRLGIINVEMPGFTNLYEHPGWIDAKERYSLLLSTFSPIPFTSDTSYIFYQLGKDLDRLDRVLGRAIYNDFSWPREPSQTPVDVFGFETITQPDGFLVPGKDQGSIHIADMRGFPQSNPVVHDIVYDFDEDYEWFFHRVVWKDIDGDGRKDALCCRARRDQFEGDFTELVWYKNPLNPFERNWQKTYINDRCDTFSLLRKMTVEGREKDALFTVRFFTRALVVHWSTREDDSWADPQAIETRTIDTGAQFFDLELTDVNNDGRVDLLVTLNADVGGSVEVYQMPNDFRTGEYIRHTLADGFDSRSGLVGGGSPGSAETFYPDATAEEAGGKTWILLSGDDDGRAYYMTPVSEDPSSWDYNLVTILDEGPGTIIGKLAAADFDGDGFKELILPSWHRDRLYVYSFSPESNEKKIQAGRKSDN